MTIKSYGDTSTTHYDISLNADTLSNRQNESNGLAQLLERILNQILQTQASEQHDRLPDAASVW